MVSEVKSAGFVIYRRETVIVKSRRQYTQNVGGSKAQENNGNVMSAAHVYDW